MYSNGREVLSRAVIGIFDRSSDVQFSSDDGIVFKLTRI